jgi:hypothetical protein
MTQNLKDSLSGVEIIFDHIIDTKALSTDFSDGKKYSMWMVEVERSTNMVRWRGVDTKNNWVPIFVGIGGTSGYITIPTYSTTLLWISEIELRELYCDIAKRLGASDVFFNGKSLIREKE